MSGVEIRTVGPDDGGQRLDRWFRRHYPDLAHGRLEKLLRTGQVRVDGGRAKASTRLEAGQEVRVPPLGKSGPAPAKTARPAAPVSAADAEALRAAVLFRDDWVLALNKPAGLAVQGGSGKHRHLDGMLDALQFDAPERPRLVHRLDQDTAGVLLLARTAEAARRLTASFRNDEARKLYWALVAGAPRKARGQIALPLGKLPGRGGERMTTDAPDAKPAETRYTTVRTAGKGAWLALRPLTGRTHQLRAHCAAIGHPILGDGKYGGQAAFLARPALSRQLMLLAREIALPHPEDGLTLRVSAPLPAHMVEAFAAFGFDPDGDAAVEAARYLEV